jgi:hypothetical protein
MALRFLAFWAVLGGLMVLWALATPISSAPDEPSHLVKAAAVSLGQLTGDFGSHGTQVVVPQYIAFTHGQTCTAFHDTVTADCIPPVPGDPSALVGSATTAGLYNPVYYALVGWPVHFFHDSSGVFAIRIVSALLVSAFAALSALMISTWRHRVLPLIALGTALTPMVFFLGGVVNPNSLEITATLALFVAVLSIVFEPSNGLLWQRAVIASVAGIVAVNMRGLSPLWVAVAVGAPLLLATREQLRATLKTRALWIAISAVGVGSLFAVGWIIATNSLAPHANGSTSVSAIPYHGESPVVGFFLMLAALGNQLREMVGSFGWLDTLAPLEIYIIWTLFIGGLGLTALLLTSGKTRRFVAALAIAFVVLPALAQAAFITSGGFIWQGRYSLPLLTILIVGAGAVLARKFESAGARITLPLSAGAWIAWTAGQLYTYVATIHRYASGVKGSWIATFSGAKWAPPGGAVLLVILFVLLASVVAAYGIYTARNAVHSSSEPTR